MGQDGTDRKEGLGCTRSYRSSCVRFRDPVMIAQYLEEREIFTACNSQAKHFSLTETHSIADLTTCLSKKLGENGKNWPNYN